MCVLEVVGTKPWISSTEIPIWTLDPEPHTESITRTMCAHISRLILVLSSSGIDSRLLLETTFRR